MSYEIVTEPGGFYTIRQVPIFETHNDRGFICDENWMSDAIHNFNNHKEQGYRPTVIVGHNVKGQEKEAVGFLDNLVLKGKRLYADICRIPSELKEKIVKNAYPNRSVEVLPKGKRILALALLGGTTPHFVLPQMSYSYADGNKEDSEWIDVLGLESNNRSDVMPFTDEQKKELYDMVGGAISAALPNALKSIAEEGSKVEAPQIYEISTPEATKLFQSGEELPEIFKGPDGKFYSVDENGTYYAWPDWVSKFGLEETIAEELFKKAGNLGGKLNTAMLKHRVPMTVGQLSGIGVGGYIGAKKAKKHKVLGALGGSFIGGNVGGYGALGAAHGISKMRGYAIDENSGIVYYDGRQVGMVVPTANQAPAAIPGLTEGEGPMLQTDPGPEYAPELTTDPGPINTPHIDELAEDTDEGDFMQPPGEGEAEGMEGEYATQNDVQLYNLQQEVAQLKFANTVLQEGRKAEELKKYLMDQKKMGAPVGDVESTVEYLMTQEPEQVNKFKSLLEKSPKVQLGRMQYEEGGGNGATEVDVIQEYAMNKDVYQKLGLTPKDIQIAKYTRFNRFVGEVQK